MHKLVWILSLTVLAAGLVLGGCGRKPWYRYYDMDEEQQTRSADNMDKMLKAMKDGWCEGAEALGNLRGKAIEILPELEETVANNTCYEAGIKAIGRIKPGGPEAMRAMLKAGQNGHCHSLEGLAKKGAKAKDMAPEIFVIVDSGECYLEAFKAARQLAPESEKLLTSAFRVIERTEVSKFKAWSSLRSQTETLDEDYVAPLKRVVAKHRDQAVKELVGLMGSERWESRYCAARLLATTKSRDDKVIAAIDQAQKDENEDVRKAAEAAYRKLKFTDIAAAEKITVILQLVDQGGQLTPSALTQLTDYLHAQMASQAGFSVIPQEQLRKELKGQKVESFKAGFDESTQLELGKAMAAQKSIVVKLLKMDAGCSITGTVFDLTSETTEKSTTVESNCTSEGFKTGMKEISEKLAQGALK